MIRTLNDKSIYPSLHREIFGQEVEPPEVVKVGETKNGVIFGFLSGRWELNGTFYIEYAGVMPGFQKKGYLRHLRCLLCPTVDYLTATKNNNVIAMKTLLATGFIPVGCHQRQDTFYIEWIRRGIKNG